MLTVGFFQTQRKDKIPEIIETEEMPRYSYRPTYIHIDLTKTHYVDWIRFLKESENWGIKEIEEYQLNQIKRIVKYAYDSCWGYRSLYDEAGVTPDSIKTLEDFRNFPFVTKEIIGQNLEAFSAPVTGRKYVTTGGSTGTPFGFYRDKVAFARELASKAYQYYRTGWKEGDRQIVFRGLVIPSPNHIKYYPRFNELRCSSYHLMPKWMELYRRRALEYKPKWIKCYPSAGFLYAKFLEETRRQFPHVKGILCASEILFDYQKKLFNRVFDARVFSHYGQYEQTVLAGYCEYEDTYHVLPQYGYAELIDSKGKYVEKPGRTGEIVGTSFIMHATPFIRYKTRDFATLKGFKCHACNRSYQILERVEGRQQEFIVTANSRKISMTAINMHDSIFDHIKRYQFYQEKKGLVVFRYVPRETCNEHHVANIKRGLMVKMGDDVELDMEVVKEIPLTQRGKHKVIIQKISEEQI